MALTKSSRVIYFSPSEVVRDACLSNVFFASSVSNDGRSEPTRDSFTTFLMVAMITSLIAGFGGE